MSVLFVFLLSGALWGEEVSSPAKISWIKEVGQTYHGAKSVQMSVQKNIKQYFLPKPKQSKGTLTIKNDNFRLELDGDEKSLVVVNSGQVKIFTMYPKESGLKTSVIETSFNKKGGDVQEMFASLLTGKDIESQFNVKSSKKTKDEIEFELVPKKPITELENVIFKVSSENYHIKEISLIDNLKNKTQYLVSDIEFNKAVDDKLFQVETPKDAIVQRF